MFGDNMLLHFLLEMNNFSLTVGIIYFIVGWFQVFFIFHPLLGEDFHFD